MDSIGPRSATLGAKVGRLGATIALAAAAVFAVGTPASAYTPAVTFAGTADYDNDGNEDIIARDRAGLLWLPRPGHPRLQQPGPLPDRQRLVGDHGRRPGRQVPRYRHHRPGGPAGLTAPDR